MRSKRFRLVTMDFVVYCDESRHEHASGNRFMAIGGLWVPRDTKYILSVELRRLLAANGLRGEAKWSKTSLKRLDAYKKLVDFFIDHNELQFRAIVVEHGKVDAERYHGGDRELGFYKFYYKMLEKWIEEGNQYLILLDFKMNKGADRYTTLRTFLERRARGKAWITDLTVVDSRQSVLAQLADVLTGAVAASWCGLSAGTAKEKLAQHLAKRGGRASLRVPDFSPARSKLNIFKIQL